MSNPNGPTSKTLIVVALVGAAVVGSLAAYVKFAPADRVPADQRRIEATQTRKPAPAPKVDVSVHEATIGEVYIYEPYFIGETLQFRSRLASVPRGTEPELFALSEFLTQTKITDEKARLLNVDVKDGLAALSFNAAFGPTFGAEDEHVLIEGMRRELGQFPKIEKFEIYIDGTRADTLGNVDLSEPIEVVRTPKTDESPKSPDQG